MNENLLYFIACISCAMYSFALCENNLYCRSVTVPLSEEHPSLSADVSDGFSDVR